ncbi:hypothetical protein LTR15_001187 [Elasticomyces elasticus]|nr:hypothetical protein LTR15_001187 [Elasticomyces elasticus]
MPNELQAGETIRWVALSAILRILHISPKILRLNSLTEIKQIAPSNTQTAAQQSKQRTLDLTHPAHPNTSTEMRRSNRNKGPRHNTNPDNGVDLQVVVYDPSQTHADPEPSPYTNTSMTHVDFTGTLAVPSTMSWAATSTNPAPAKDIRLEQVSQRLVAAIALMQSAGMIMSSSAALKCFTVGCCGLAVYCASKIKMHDY